MKPVLISQYLSHIGQGSADDRQAPRRDNAPPRPRPVLAMNGGEARGAAPLFRTLSDVASNARARAAVDAPEPVKWPLARREAGASPTRESAPAPSFEARIEDAYARGAQDGAASARAELAEARAADIAAQREQTIVERLDFHLNEYAQLANVIGAGLVEIEERISASVARILAPFVENRMARQVVDELCESLRGLRAGGSPAPIKIRGPERLLHLLRERAAPLGAQVEYVAQDGIEVVVEARDTHIETQLKPWADLLAIIDR